MSTVTTGAPIAAPSTSSPTAGRSTQGRLIQAELLKIWTTNSWWIFGLFILGWTAVALLTNIASTNFQLNDATRIQEQGEESFTRWYGAPDEEPPPGYTEQMHEEWLRVTDTQRIVISGAANIFTSGQFLGLLFIAILGVLIVTNEFHHQTATTTFLTTPTRTRVVTSKLIAAVGLAVGFWALTTVIDIAAGATDFAVLGHSVPWGEWTIWRAVVMNLLAFVIWALLGVGLGVLIRNQLGGTLITSVLYMASFPVAVLLFGAIYAAIREDWIWNWPVVLPGVASWAMTSPDPLVFGNNDGITWWVGALVLIGYGVAAVVIGTLITRRRDIS